MVIGPYTKSLGIRTDDHLKQQRSYVTVTSHLLVPLEVPVVVSHPGFVSTSPVVSVKSPGIKTGDPLKQ